ncbi:MAG: ATP-grasp domain-containing protein [Clostridia bacterium]|nr:ATP-grasp domain-containing protein [Clostridia bacterium]
MKQNVAVFFGGKSNEHDISIITGIYAVNLLRGAGYQVIPVYLPREGGMCFADAECVKDITEGKKKFVPAYLFEGGLWSVKKKKELFSIDAALNCCHGGAGEDGTLSALLKWNTIPFASPDTAVSSVFMDKWLGKIAARGLNIPTARAVCVKEGESVPLEEVGGFPVIVKPVTLGSSIGIKIAHNDEELENALEYAFRLDNAVLVEEYFSGKRDINCAAYRRGGEVVTSPLEEVFSNEAILSFHEKYEQAAKQSQLPAELAPELTEEIKGYTAKIYESFSCKGVVRADFLIADGKAYFNELNTVPGSLSCYLFGESLSDAREFLSSLVEEVLQSKTEEKEIIHTSVLDSAVFAGGKGSKRRG